MSVGSRTTLSSGFFASVVSGAADVGGAGAGVDRGATGAAVRVLGCVDGALGRGDDGVVRGGVDVGADDELGGADVVVGGGVVGVVVVGVADVVVSVLGNCVSCERWVNTSAPATTRARKPTLITLAATRFVDSVMRGSYGGLALPATRGANLLPSTRHPDPTAGRRAAPPTASTTTLGGKPVEGIRGFPTIPLLILRLS
jgi:hypothetical protein